MAYRKKLCVETDSKGTIRNGVPPQNTLFINRELSDFAFLKIHKDLEELVALYKSELHPQGRIYIFIDEVQLIEEWEKSVNSYSQDYTEEYELFISGSNSRMLSGELATLLSGRYVQFPIYPFSYQEYTEIRHLEQNRESYMGYMNTGGIPELFCLARKAGGAAQLLVCLEGHHLAEGHHPTLQHT